MIAAAVIALASGLAPAWMPVPQRQREARSVRGPDADFSQLLGRPTASSVTLSVCSSRALEACIEYGAESGKLERRLASRGLLPGVPAEFEFAELAANTAYRYRVLTRGAADAPWEARSEAGFHTARPAGSSFTFTVQGDSHPERQGKMFDAALYERALASVAADAPDFHFLMGDDFSIEHLIERGELSAPAVDAVYALQRGFLHGVGRSTAVCLVNGNHEQAALYLLDGTETNAGVLAARSRNRFFPLPAPNDFYSGDEAPVEHVGLLRDYYAWTWGDALFVVIDPYWHSSVAVDNEAGRRRGNEEGGKRGKSGRDEWQITLGEAQYRWLASTLSTSRARWKFVFAHHVSGTGRGGVELAGLNEWGGRDKRGVERFAERRPGWDAPIHALFVRHGVTIFFQGHDHLYARQELDGVVYQSCPNPADPTYTAFNREAYRSGDVLPNSGHLRVRVSPERVSVEYVLAVLAADESPERRHDAVAHAYALEAPKPANLPLDPATPEKADGK